MTPEVAAAIARLEERTAMPMAKSIGSIPVSCADIAALISAYREAERDAARYRKLREWWCASDDDVWHGTFIDNIAVAESGKQFDAHIDAAIAKGGSNAG